MQMSYSAGPGNVFSGAKMDLGPHGVISLIATIAAAMGRGIFRQYGAQEQGRLPVENQTVITDSAGTFTAGSIATTVNGTVITTNWTSDKNTTMTAHAAAIASGVANVSACTHDTGAHTITIQTRNTNLVVSVSVASVTGTMTISSIVNTSLDAATNFAGVTIHDYAREQATDGTVAYAVNDVMSVMRRGCLAVAVEETVTTDDPVYVRTMADGTKLAGMFGKSSVSGKTVALTNCRFERGGTTTQPAVLFVNLP
jgi:hypothetical protein